AANHVTVVVAGGGATDAIAGAYGRRPVPVPTPVISHAILTHNRGSDYREWASVSANGSATTAGRRFDIADGIVATPSHNPPRDGGFKYNPPSGGPASSEDTTAIQRTANDY